MGFVVPFTLFNMVCTWLQCELGASPPYLHVSPRPKTSDKYVELPIGRSDFDTQENGPLVFTKLGAIQGFTENIGDQRQIYSFTGIPYGEEPGRFRDPEPRRPWKGILQAKTQSPFCIQANLLTIGMTRGQEDCLYLDVHTSYLPDPNRPKRAGMPVIMLLPAGANLYGRSRNYGPAYLLKEDAVFVPINIRCGIYGFMSTGDEASPGNYALKDMALAIKYVYENIEAFGGDPRKIILLGISSGAYYSQLMLYTKHEARNYVAGVIAISGSPFANHGLDAIGRVQNASNIVAAAAGCPTGVQGRSREMVECLRKLNPHFLHSKQNILNSYTPTMSKMLGPSLEPDLPNAFISELPEVQYEKGTVPPIPVILSRTEDESTLAMPAARRTILPIIRLKWHDWMPKILRTLGIRGANRGQPVSYDESQFSLLKVNRFYFNKTTPPRFILKKDYMRFVDMVNDFMYIAPMWKGAELHHKIAPTYVFKSNHKTYGMINPIVSIVQDVFNKDFGASHATDYALLFNNSRVFPPLQSGSDYEKASRNLINMIVNFGFYGKPLYRTPTGTLLNLWKPIESMKRPMVLDVGLVHNISMVRDPVPGSGRLKIWDEVKF